MNALFSFFLICALVVVVLFFAYFYTIFYNAMPYNAQSSGWMQGVYSWTFGFFDRSFLIFFILTILGSGFVAIAHPNAGVGALDLLCLLVFAFAFVNVRGGFMQVASAMSMNTLMPNTYATLNSNWTALFVFVGLALEGMLNFRKSDGGDSPPIHYSAYEAAWAAGGENHVNGE